MKCDHRKVVVVLRVVIGVGGQFLLEHHLLVVEVTTVRFDYHFQPHGFNLLKKSFIILFFYFNFVYFVYFFYLFYLVRF